MENANVEAPSTTGGPSRPSTAREQPAASEQPADKYPIAVFFIYGAEFCERFNYYGLKAILTEFLMDDLNFSKLNAKRVFNFFNLLCYIFPLIGAVLCNKYLGLFRTIFFVGLIYLLGCIGLALVETAALPFPEMMLMVISFGVGSMKPCMQTLGADQFQQPQQFNQLKTYFIWFYLAVNCGAVTTIFITPIAKHIFGFWLPSLLLLVALAIFLVGKFFYKVAPVNKDLSHIVGCICYAVKQRFKSSEKKSHWLEHALPQYDEQLVADLKVVLRLLIIFIPIPLFWAMYYEQWGCWIKVLYKTNRFFRNKLVEADTFDLVNPIFVVLFIPLFKFVIYRFVVVRVMRKPLYRIIAGGILVGVAFILAGVVALQAEKEEPPRRGTPLATGHLVIYNNLQCEVTAKMTVNGSGREFLINTHKFINVNDLPLTKDSADNYTVQVTDSCIGPIDRQIYVGNDNVEVLVLDERKRLSYPQHFDRHKDGFPQIRVSISAADRNDAKVKFYYYGVLHLTVTQLHEDVYELPFPNSFDIYVDDAYVTTLAFHVRSTYQMLVKVDNKNPKQSKVTLYEIVSNDRIHFFWLFPQYIVLAPAEILFAISSMEFAYTQVPLSMKVTMQSLWLFMVGIGKIIELFLEAVVSDASLATNIFIYAVFMFVDVAVLGALTFAHNYVEDTI